jgi:hypothetical protein
VEQLKSSYSDTTPVTGADRKPAFAELEKAVGNLGKVFTVRQDGKGDFKSIQAAIDAAPPNSMVWIEDAGPYREQVLVPREKEGLRIRGNRRALPIITSLGKPELMRVNLVSLQAPRSVLERAVVIHACAPGENQRCVSIFGTEVRIRSTLICMAGSVEALWLSDQASAELAHVVLGARAVVNGRLVARNCLVANRDRPEHNATPEAASLMAFGSPSSIGLRQCTLLGSVAYSASAGEAGTMSECVAFAVLAPPSVVIESSNVYGKYPGAANGFAGPARPGKGTFSADPMFRDPANLDFRLRPGSPCIGKASDGGDIGCRYTPEMIELVNVALDLRRRGVIKF